MPPVPLPAASLFLFLHLLLRPSTSAASLTLRQRRQSLYVCGTFPHQYYSSFPCSVNGNQYQPAPAVGYGQCANGGRFLGVGCYYDYQCTPYAAGQGASCVGGCCCTLPTGGLTGGSLGYCPAGQRSQVSCTSNSACGTGQTCNNGLCCTTTGQEYQNACGGIGALSACNAGSCGSFVCVSSNYCCECQYGRSAGLCANGCPSGYTCAANGYCCATCPNGRTPFGVCYQGQCPAGHNCNVANVCCPL